MRIGDDTTLKLTQALVVQYVSFVVLLRGGFEESQVDKHCQVRLPWLGGGKEHCARNWSAKGTRKDFFQEHRVECSLIYSMPR